jgi:hypothetical protein
LIESKFISRAATFTFFIGDRFFGVITAYVQGDNAGLYHFTSSLPVQIVKFLKPVLSPLINNTSPAKEVTEPLAKVTIAENDTPAIKVTNTKIVNPAPKVIKAKILKPVPKATNTKNQEPLAKSAAPKIFKQPMVEKLDDRSAKPTLAKVPSPKVIKPLAKESLIKNTKLSENEKPPLTEKNDSATRYYKYPTAVTPAQ